MYVRYTGITSVSLTFVPRPQSERAVFLGLYDLGPSRLLAALLAAPTLP